jgi:HAD superfamily hydrolase (TIGR01509 family)
LAIEAVVFDFDGLIADTETPEYQSWAQVYAEHGSELPIDVWSVVIGTDGSGIFDPYADLAVRTGRRIDKAAVQTRRAELYAAALARLEVRPGVREYLDEAEHLGLRIGLASSSSRDWVTRHLGAFGLLHYFICLRTRDDVQTVKPDPALYRETLACLGVRPEAAVAFEDSVNGAQAALAAGMRCIIVPNEVTGHLTFPPVHRRLHSMADMPLARLLAELEDT